jgi:sugar phosphate isomerase/epimerase
MTRRDCLATLMFAAAAGAKEPKYAPILAGQAYVWQQVLGREKRTIADGLEDVMASLAKSGYRRLELTSAFFTPELADRSLRLLDKHRMKLDIVYNGGVMHEPAGAEKTILETIALARRLKPAGIQCVNFNANPKPKRERKTDAELEVQTKAISELARQIHREGLRLLLHQHAPELAENGREWRHIMNGTDPKQAEICLDVHWILRGGLEPMAFLRESMPRLASLHLRNSRNGVWLEDLSDGDIDYRAVAAELRKSAFRGWLVVELALDPQTTVTRSVTENLRRSREYARRIFV